MLDLLNLIIQGTLIMILILSPFFIAYFVLYYLMYFIANKKYIKAARVIKNRIKKNDDWTIKKDKNGKYILKVGGLKK